jgi:UDP-GlcNAc:undecaprenyl-phosphate/decaprenyl-phosphate GlcNAc-1-phosphate transferase
VEDRREIGLLVLMAVLAPLLATYLLTPFYIKYQEKRKITAVNFQGNNVVTTGGMVLLMALFSAWPFYLFLPGRAESNYWMLMLLYISGITFLGAIDDIWGETKYKGFRGHLRKMWRGEGISTGLYKAVGGVLFGFIASAVTVQGYVSYEWFIKGIFLALFSNFFNFLDTRPARAAKVFFIFSLVFMLLLRGPFLMLFSLWGALYIYLFWEIKTKIMLGDTGAYLIGGVLGFYLILTLSNAAVLYLNILLIFLHWYCEKFSLNKLIEGMG